MELPCGATGTVFLEPLDHAFEIGIASAKAARKPVSTALGDPLAISENLELTGAPRISDSLNAEALLDEGHETRDLSAVVVSGGAMNDLDLHLFSNSYNSSGSATSGPVSFFFFHCLANQCDVMRL
jgi:xanthine/CO dehydrogenase XdhC/CoxF family maturation factor